MPVNTKSKLLTDAASDLFLVKSLWGGTQAMRDAGTAFLPREVGETKDEYENRKARSTLTNVFKKTVNTLTGRIFSEQARIDDDSAFEEFSANVDAEGRSFHRFCYDVARYAMRDGLRFIMVDMPIADGAKTKADEKALGIRPYWVEIDIRSVLGWTTAIINGQRFLTQFRYLEAVEEARDEFTTEAIEQIRVIDPNMVRLYRKNKNGEWYLFETIATTFAVVPVIPIYGSRFGYFEFEPPLLDLAHLNVEHWQKSSDQSNILHVARVPILHWAGYTPGYDQEGNPIELVIGPNTLAKSADSGARLEYVEHSGAAIGAGREDLLDIENRMEAMGAEFTTANRSGTQTATEKSINESGDISELQAFAENLKDSLELALEFTGEAMGKPFVGEVYLNSDLGAIKSPINIPELVKLRALGDISRDQLVSILSEEWGIEIDSADGAEYVVS